MNMACKYFFSDFQWIFRSFKNICGEEIDDLSKNSFTGILNIKAKQLSSAKLPKKMQIAFQNPGSTAININIWL